MEPKAEQLNYYFNQLTPAEQDSILQLLETSIKEKDRKAEQISTEQYNAEIEVALAEADRGETFTHEEVVALSKQW